MSRTFARAATQSRRSKFSALLALVVSLLSTTTVGMVAAPAAAAAIAPALASGSGYVEGVSIELPELRTEFTRSYRNPNGTNTTRVFPRPVSYSVNGAWAPIDSALVGDVVPGSFRT